MRALSIIAVLCALALVGVGCGDDDDDNGGSSGNANTTETKSGAEGGGGASDTGGGGKAQTLKLSADPGGALKFDKSSLTAKAGKVTIVLDNPSSLPHAVEIEGNGIEEESDTIGEGETTKVTATVKAGGYEYYCPVDGHKAAGMEGTLTVQ
ncbi:MAG TPA: plastocyanin/azurin family copper-binding protein [Thermoleophilaceae bacterium]|nr:plastocyanin/azurin family copper-binding protein [Thermoleophilaceae bacterium]